MMGRFKKHQHPLFFLEDENFFSKIGHAGTILFAIPRGTNAADF
jgi:hypothetical protein